MSFLSNQSANSQLERLSEKGKPSYGIVTAVDITNAVTVGTRKAAKSPSDVSYTISCTTDMTKLTLTNMSPSQARWDCLFYPAPVGAIAEMYWIGGVVYFTVLELPVTKVCASSTTPGSTSPTLRDAKPVQFMPIDSALIDYEIGKVNR